MTSLFSNSTKMTFRLQKCAISVMRLLISTHAKTSMSGSFNLKFFGKMKCQIPPLYTPILQTLKFTVDIYDNKA